MSIKGLQLPWSVSPQAHGCYGSDCQNELPLWKRTSPWRWSSHMRKQSQPLGAGGRRRGCSGWTPDPHLKPGPATSPGCTRFRKARVHSPPDPPRAWWSRRKHMPRWLPGRCRHAFSSARPLEVEKKVLPAWNLPYTHIPPLDKSNSISKDLFHWILGDVNR